MSPHPLIIIGLLAAACAVVHTSSQAFLGWRLGVGIEKISFFIGPTIVRVRIHGSVLVVNLIPLGGGYIKFRSEETAPEVRGMAWADVSPVRRILIIASGSLATGAIALICLGPAHGLRSTGHGFGQVMLGGFAPFSVGTRLIGAMLAVVRVSSVVVILGIVAAKMTALNLLPWPPFGGGQILISLAEWRRRLPERVVLGLNLLGLSIALCMFGLWLAALAEYFLRR